MRLLLKLVIVKVVIANLIKVLHLQEVVIAVIHLCVVVLLIHG